MSDDRTTRSTTDPKVNRIYRRQQERNEARAVDALREVMRTPAGRMFVWDLLASFGVFRSIWENSARIHYNAGRQDAGHELMARVLSADEELYEQMEREARGRAKRDKHEREAAHTQAAAPQETTE